MKSPSFQKITIDEDVADLPMTRRLTANAREAGIPVSSTDQQRDAINDGHTFTSGKREIFVTRHRGTAVKTCTGKEPQYICCNLRIMNQTTSCPLDCSYCILQSYINQPVITVNADIEAMLAEAAEISSRYPERLLRIGTGDLADALVLDPLGEVSRELVPGISRMSNVLLELKTKSNMVEQLAGLDHRGRVVVSWSLNSEEVIASDEHRCATLEERLAAAALVVSRGYLVAFHFDPMITHNGWRDNYTDVVARLFDAVPADRVAFISMGALRFPPSMSRTMGRRFPRSRLLTGELILASDGKIRYLKPIRVAMYRTLESAVRRFGGPEVYTYLCMEPRDVWRRTMSIAPKTTEEHEFEFASSLVRRYPYLMKEAPRLENYTDRI